MLPGWILVFAGVAGLAAGPAAAVEMSDRDLARQYAACMAQAETEPQDAFNMAIVWQDMGGGDAARHCAAKALFFLGQFEEAARRFEALAQDVKSGPKFKAELLSHAAQGWMQDDSPERADDILTAALKLNPEDPTLWVDRGLARAGLRSYRAAIADFDRALELDPEMVDAYTFRATAHSYLEEMDAAAADIERALALDSLNPDALLERGILRRLGADAAGARADWLLVIEMAPGTPAAATAQANLQKLDLGDSGG
ncbi:MAG: tetratricopeptide repeat protein [Rhodospirillales bacterium]|nr:tetratricopeptide repeat protein [Rhodospirillales bacterium]